MGRDGWIGVGWPKAFGGQGRSPTEQIAFVTEMANAGAPIHAHTTGESIVAQSLFLHGTQGSSRTNGCPAIRRGERPFALGYSEPEAGSDLAALRTRAVRDGDDWVVNGQKLWSTGADKARVHVARGAHRPGGEEARRHQRADGRSALARRHDPAEHGALRQDLQRALLRQRAGAGEEHGRRGQQRLEGHHRCARRRARHDRRHADGEDRARVRPPHRIS